MSPKIALITGAGTGIGRAVAIGLAESHRVVLTGRRLEPLGAVADEIRRAGGHATPVASDITDPASVKALFARIVADHGRLDLLFNNAGANGPSGPLEDLALADWKQVIDTNVTGVFLCTQEAFRLMKSQDPRGGRIINNGSLAASVPRPHTAAYAASKHAVGGLTKVASLEGRRNDIACGQINIGNVATSIGSHAARGTLQADGSTAVEPMLDVAHVVRAVNYMASLPIDANVLSLDVMPSKIPFVGRG